MQRRTFLAVATALGGVSVGGVGSSIAEDDGESHLKMRFYSPASQLAADGTALTDESIVGVWTEESAYNFDSSRGGFAHIRGHPDPVDLR